MKEERLKNRQRVEDLRITSDKTMNEKVVYCTTVHKQQYGSSRGEL